MAYAGGYAGGAPPGCGSVFWHDVADVTKKSPQSPTALCCLFLADIVLEIFRKPWGWKNVVTAAGGIVLCLPYTAILGHTGIHLPYACSFGLWLLPLVRAVRAGW